MLLSSVRLDLADVGYRHLSHAETAILCDTSGTATEAVRVSNTKEDDADMNTTDAPTDPLLRPFRLKHLTLKNRVMSTSHACGLHDGGMPAERYQRYHEEKAKGGIALSMFGGSSNVAPDSPNTF
jgi:hypothetical protein